MTRKQFIKNSTAACFIASSGKAVGAGAPSNRVRLAIMGCRPQCRGVWLMRAGMAMKDAEIAAVCETDLRGLDAAAAEVKEKTGKMPKKTTDMRKLLEDPEIDAILCEVPDHWHAPAAWMTMNAGKHIYVEKPCTFNGEEAQILMATQKKTGKVFQMGSQRRSSATYQKWIKTFPSLIGEAKFARCWYTSRRGRGPERIQQAVPEWLDWDVWQGPAPRQAYETGLVHYGWHWTRKWGTGEMGNNSPHFLDIARWALDVGFATETVSIGSKLYHDGDKNWEWADTQSAIYKFANGKTVTFDCYCNANWKNPENIGTGAVVYCEAGAIFFHPKDAVYVYDNKGRKIAEEADPSCDEWIQSTTGASYLDTNHLANFCEAIRRNNPDRCYSPVVTGCASTMMAHTANMAADTGEKILLDSETGKLLNTQAEVKKLWSREYEKGWEPKI